MKNDELLDLITKLKVDDTFVEEAIAADREGAPVRVYAGKAKSPMRIVAPIAACLAVTAAAGILVVNVNRGKIAAGPAASIEESSEVNEASGGESKSVELTGLTETEFRDKCISLAAEKTGDVLLVNTFWQTKNLDLDFDGEEELLVYPLCDGRIPLGTGIRVFKRTDVGGIQDLGAFATESDYFTENFYFSDEDAQKYFYYNWAETDESCTETIFEVYLNNDGVIEENAYLRFATTFPRDEASSTPLSEKAFINGSEVSAEELLIKWKAVPNMPNVNGYYDKAIMIKIVDYLAEKYDLTEEHYNDLMKIYTSSAPISQDDPCAHIAVGGVDYDGDGRSETTVRFRNCPELPGNYIFSTVNGEPKLLAVEGL